MNKFEDKKPPEDKKQTFIFSISADIQKMDIKKAGGQPRQSGVVNLAGSQPRRKK
ncbi:MAG: hypothetical protein V1759_01555 [bacterium]